MVGYKPNTSLMSELSGIRPEIIDAIYDLAVLRSEEYYNSLRDSRYDNVTEVIGKLGELNQDIIKGTSNMLDGNKVSLPSSIGHLLSHMVLNEGVPKLLNVHEPVTEGIRNALVGYLVPILRLNTPTRPIVAHLIARQRLTIELREDNGYSELVIYAHHYRDEFFYLALKLRIRIDAGDELVLDEIHLDGIDSKFNVESVRYCLLALSLCGIGRLCGGNYFIPQISGGYVKNVNVESFPRRD